MPEQLLEFSANHPILVLSFASLLGLILFTEFRNFTKKFSNIGPAATISLMNTDKTVLLDVREMSELKDGMLTDAIHIPLSAFNKRVAEMDKYKDDSVVVYCRSGNRSGGVCRTLTGRGFEKVFNLSGGILAWKDAHLPIQQKQKAKGKNKKSKKKDNG